MYYYEYLYETHLYNWEIDYLEKLKKNKKDLQYVAERRLEYAIKNYPDDKEFIKDRQKSLDYIINTL